MTRQLPFRAVLRNGETVLVREIGPQDRRLLRDGFEKLSKQSRYFRFLAPHQQLSKAELDRFTEANTDEHFAIGAASIGVEADMPLATARYVRVTPGADMAEIAVTIIDSHQRLGLGSLLLRALATQATAQSINTLSALVHRDNLGMQALLQRFGGVNNGGSLEEEWHLPLPLKQQATVSQLADHITIPGAKRRR